jgi:MFS family permease
MRAVLADPRLRLYYLAIAVSTFGDYSLYLALGVWVKLLTGSTGLAGVCFLALILGSLASPLTGILVDRFRRRPLMIWTNVGTAALLLLLLAVHDRHQVWLVFAVTFGYGVAGTVTTGAQQALVQRIVPPDLLADANGIQQTAIQGLRLVTPLAGVGLLALVGAPAVILMDVATFLVGAVCLAAMRVDEDTVAAGPPRRHWAADVATGVRYLARTPVLRQVVLASTVIVLCIGMYETLGLQVVTVGLHRAPTWFGVYATVQGIGGLAGGVTAGHLTRRLGSRRLIIVGMALWAATGLLMTAPVPALVLTGAALAGVGLPWLIVGATTTLQRHTPNRMAGRVMGAAELALSAPQSIGIALGAGLVDAVFYRYLCFATVVAIVVAAACLGGSARRRAVVVPEGVYEGV